MDRLRAGPHLLGSLLCVGHFDGYCATRGGSRSGGVFGPLGTAVPWSDSPEGQGGPRQCYSCVRFRLFGFSGKLLGYLFGVLRLWGWDTVGLVPFKTCPLLGNLFVVLSFSLVVWLILSSSFFFFLSSLSQVLGKPKPRLGFGFPLVFSSC